MENLNFEIKYENFKVTIYTVDDCIILNFEEDKYHELETFRIERSRFALFKDSNDNSVDVYDLIYKGEKHERYVYNGDKLGNLIFAAFVYSLAGNIDYNNLKLNEYSLEILNFISIYSAEDGYREVYFNNIDGSKDLIVTERKEHLNWELDKLKYYSSVINKLCHTAKELMANGKLAPGAIEINNGFIEDLYHVAIFDFSRNCRLNNYNQVFMFCGELSEEHQEGKNLIRQFKLQKNACINDIKSIISFFERDGIKCSKIEIRYRAGEDTYSNVSYNSINNLDNFADFSEPICVTACFINKNNEDCLSLEFDTADDLFKYSERMPESSS